MTYQQVQGIARRSVLVALSIAMALIGGPVDSSAKLESLVTTQLQRVLCAAAGGKAEVHVERLGSGDIDHTIATCLGGLLDGMSCVNVDPYVDCSRATARKAGERQMDYPNDPPLPTPAPTAQPGQGAGAGSVQASEIAIVDGMVQVAELPPMSVSEMALAFVNGCRVLGGIDQAVVQLDAWGELAGGRVRCDGGLADGFDCTRVPESFTCSWLRDAPEGSVRTDMTTVTLETEIGELAEGDDLPAAAQPALPPEPTFVTETSVEPNPTVMPTVAPTAMPTVEPTTAPTVEPTEPADPPTFPTPPTNDVVVPPGEAEDPVVEPTPTVVVLT